MRDLEFRAGLKSNDRCPFEEWRTQRHTGEKATCGQRQKWESCGPKITDVWSHQQLEETRKDSPLETWSGSWSH